jgi:phosphatidylcholine synthase
MPNSQPTKRSGYAIHTLTASGAVMGMLALQSTFNGEVRGALIWLLASQILDGLDGPVARRFDVVVSAPRIDGHVLDLVVDYVTCVVVPIAFMIHFKMLPAHYEIALAGLTFLFSALWFSRTDLETEDSWFNGFPAAWNLAVPTLYVAHATPTQVAVVIFVLSISQLTTFQFPHIVKAEWMRKVTLPFGILYLFDIAYISVTYSDVEVIQLNAITGGILFGFPLYAFIIGTIRTLRIRALKKSESLA